MTDLLLHGATLSLAWFLVVNAAASAAAAAIARSAGTRRTRPGSSAFWLALRLLPSAAGALFVVALFAPSYWKYEPREAVEGFDVTLTALAVLALLLGVAGAARGALAWRRAALRVRAWTRAGRPMRLAGIDIPVWSIDAPGPLMALAGVLRPRLFISRGLLEALTPDELGATVAHEIGHLRAHDNLKRLVIRAAPDLLTATAAARRIERRWAAAAEQRADRQAGSGSAARRCALASALLKIARMVPAATPFPEPISTLVGGGEIASRIERLLEDRLPPPARPVARDLACGAAAIAAALAAYGPLLRAVHGATELLVRSLP